MKKLKQQKILDTHRETANLKRTAEILNIPYETVRRVVKNSGAKMPSRGKAKIERSREEIESALLYCRGNMTCAGRQLSVSVLTIYRLMKDLGMQYRGTNGKRINVPEGK